MLLERPVVLWLAAVGGGLREVDDGDGRWSGAGGSCLLLLLLIRPVIQVVAAAAGDEPASHG